MALQVSLREHASLLFIIQQIHIINTHREKALCASSCLFLFFKAVCICTRFAFRFSNRDSAISFSDRIKSGVVGEQLWLQITEPTEKDMGKYAIEFYDGKGGLRRTVELSGQGDSQGL